VTKEGKNEPEVQQVNGGVSIVFHLNPWPAEKPKKGLRPVFRRQPTLAEGERYLIEFFG